MNVVHCSSDLLRIETDPTFTGSWQAAVVKAFRRRMQVIRAVTNELELALVRGNRFEKLKGSRSHQYSVRLNDQYRLILEFQGKGAERTLFVVGIEDYH